MRHHQREKLQRHQHTKQTEEKKTASEINEQQDKRQNFKIGYRSFFFSLFFFFSFLQREKSSLWIPRTRWAWIKNAEAPLAHHTCACIFAWTCICWKQYGLTQTGNTFLTSTTHGSHRIYSTWSQQCLQHMITTVFSQASDLNINI